MDLKQIAKIVAPMIGGILLLAYQFFPSKPSEFHELYSAWIRSPKDPATWNALRKELSSVPNWSAPFLAQQLLLNEKFEEAEKLARVPLRQLRRESFRYAIYAQTTFLIAEGRYQDALEQAVWLNESMEGEETLLCGYNKLRIAALQRALDNRPGERAAWEELRHYLEAHPSLDKQINASIQENGVSLQEYIIARLS